MVGRRRALFTLSLALLLAAPVLARRGGGADGGADAAAQAQAPATAPYTAAPALHAVIVGVAPFGMIDADGRPAGVHPEIIDRLRQHCGLRIESSVVPNPRAMAMLASGEADLMFGLRSSSLDRLAHAFSPLFEGEIVVVGRAGFSPHSLADLRGKTVGHIRGTLYDLALMNDDSIGKYSMTTMEQGLAMLKEGRFDALMGTRLALGYSIQALHIPRSTLGTPLVLGRARGWAHYTYHHYDPAMVARLADCFAGLRERGEIEAIIRRYASVALQD
jgi:ABC-type amino acid transport substrate-binding protein